ncbi:MAG: AMIN-like domain-containing (lipo)protein [Nocardioides sp.]
MKTSRTAAAVTLAATLALSTLSTAAASSPWLHHGTAWTNSRAVEPRVTGLRYAAHTGFDRAVIDVDGRRPSYQTGYAKRCHYDASGKTVPIKGKRALWIALAPATAHDAGGSTYDGPDLARPHLSALRALAFTGDVESQVSFCFALNTTGSYRILRLSDPSRIVIDFQH